MSDKDTSIKEKRAPRHIVRQSYHTKYKAISRHIDWYLQTALANLPSEKWTPEEIETALSSETDIEISWDKIRRYNTKQFLMHDTAPLTRVSDSEYALNEHYYTLMGERVSEPGKAKLGRPRQRYQP